LMTNSEELAAAINKGSDTAVIKEVAMRTGMKTLHQDSILKCQEGVSTVLESISTVPPDMGVAVELEQTAAEKEAAAS